MAKAPTIAAGTGSAAKRSDPRLAKAIESAMVAAVEKCAADGITDPAKIRAAQLKAYEAAKAKAAKA